jgi:two-component system, cell cycle sensor histidine kinase DivJ
VLVLRNIADRAVGLADRMATAWLAGSNAGQDAEVAEVAVLRRLILISSTALLAVPAGLSLVTSPAVALPAGVAAVAAGFLFSAVGAIALSRLSAREERPAAVKPAQMDEAGLFAAYPGFLILFDLQGHVTAVGGRGAEGQSEQAARYPGRGFVEHIHVSDRIHFLKAIDVLRQGTRQSIGVDLRLERRSLGEGQFSHVRLELSAGDIKDGRPARIIGVLTDVSAEKDMAAELQVKSEEAASAHEAKSRFLAAVSHELRTPLNAILGFSDILAGEYFGRFENERQREYVQLIRQSGGHLLSVVNTMLDMSKIEAGHYELMLEPFAPGRAVKTCEEMLGLQAKEKGVALTSRVQREIGEVVADQRALKQILINLVGNAIKFTDAGGVVTVDAVREGDNFKLTVSDTGIGIPADKIALIGRPFTQIQNDYTRQYEGTGLGISLVKGLVALHGGEFLIDSTPGEGTVISIVLPADGSGAARAAAEGDGRMVEFPPRLKSSDTPAVSQCKEETNGRSQAKTA